MDISEKYCAFAEMQIKSISDNDMLEIYTTCTACAGNCESCALAVEKLPKVGDENGF